MIKAFNFANWAPKVASCEKHWLLDFSFRKYGLARDYKATIIE
jgi:hypothetical protein